jgi:hypothetical protein
MEISAALRDSILLLGAKRRMLLSQRDTLETLVVGSSHGDKAFDPVYCSNSFNMCYRSLDHKHCYYLYKELAALCPNMKNVVLFYSVFSPGHFLERSPGEADIGPLLNAFFGLGMRYQDDNFNIISQALTKQLQDGMDATLDVETAGVEGHSGFLPGFTGAVAPALHQARLQSHIKLNYEGGADYYVLKILALANRLGHRVCIVTPPVTSAYRQAMGIGSSQIFKELIEMVTEFPWTNSINVINCYDDEAYKDEYFVDLDHLDPRGEGPKMIARAVSALFNDAPLDEVAATAG